MEPEIYPLDDALIAYLNEGQRELETLKARAQQVEWMMNGALQYFARIHGLEGPWQLAANKRELVRETKPVETTP